DVEKFKSLYDAIRTSWGSPGPGKFNVPDLRGLFLRGADEVSRRDPDSATRTESAPGANKSGVGSLQSDGFISHVHAVIDPGHAHTVPAVILVGGGGNAAADTRNRANLSPYHTYSATTGITIAPSGIAETRPKNVYVNYLIKF